MRLRASSERWDGTIGLETVEGEGGTAEGGGGEDDADGMEKVEEGWSGGTGG